VHHQRRGRIPRTAKLTRVARKRSKRIRHLGLVEAGLYYENLLPFARRFGDRLRVILHDDIVHSPTNAYRTALLHIGAEPTFVPPALAEVRFSNRRPDEKRDGLTQDERIALWAYFRDDVRKLQRLIDRNLRIWDPTRTPASAAVSSSNA
jgi:hypothetical protein